MAGRASRFVVTEDQMLPLRRSWRGRTLGTVRRVRWGLSISLSGDLADPRLLADAALAAEQAGWDGIFVWDHLWNRTLVPFADPFVTLAAIAMATERVAIGTMVTALPRRRPQLVAQSTTSVDRLSGGRMVLGLGLGVDSYGEYSVFDEPALDDRARAAALDAGIGLLGQMLAGVPVAGAGGRVTTPASVQQPRVPIWIAGRAGLSAGPRRVRRHGLEGLALVDAESWTPATCHHRAVRREPGRRRDRRRSGWRLAS